jgi:hypothetical protein
LRLSGARVLEFDLVMSGSYWQASAGQTGPMDARRA